MPKERRPIRAYTWNPMMNNTLHVVPVNDLILHDTDSDDCPCGPRTNPVQHEDGSMGWVIVHHSLDGREIKEMK